MGGVITSSTYHQFDADSLKVIAGENFDQHIFDLHAKETNGKKVIDYNDLVRLGFVGKEYSDPSGDCDQSARTLSSIATENTASACAVEKQLLTVSDIPGGKATESISLISISTKSMVSADSNKEKVGSNNSAGYVIPDEIQRSIRNNHSFAVVDDSAPQLAGNPLEHHHMNRQDTGKSHAPAVPLIDRQILPFCMFGHTLQIVARHFHQNGINSLSYLDDIVCGVCNENEFSDSPLYFCSCCQQYQCHYCVVCVDNPNEDGNHSDLHFDDSESPAHDIDDTRSNN